MSSKRARVTTLWADDSDDASEEVIAPLASVRKSNEAASAAPIEVIGLGDSFVNIDDSMSADEKSDSEGDEDGSDDDFDDDALEDADEVIVLSSDDEEEEILQPSPPKVRSAAAGAADVSSASTYTVPHADIDADAFPDPLLPHFRPVGLVSLLFSRGVEAATIDFPKQFKGACMPVARIRTGVSRRIPATLEEYSAADGAAGAGASKFKGPLVPVWQVNCVKGGSANAASRKALAASREKLLKAVAGGGGGDASGKGKKRGGKSRRGAGGGWSAEAIEGARAIVQNARPV